MGLLADFAFGVCFIEAFGEIHFFFSYPFAPLRAGDGDVLL